MKQSVKWNTFQFLLLLMLTTFCTNLFPMLRCTSTISKSTIQMDSMCTSFAFPTISRELSLKRSGFCTARVTTMKNFLMRLEAPLSETFFAAKAKLLSRPDFFLLFGKLEFEPFSTSEFLKPVMKIKLGLMRARPNLYMISNKPDVSFVTIDCWLVTRRMLLKDVYHKKFNGRDSINSGWVQLSGDFGKNVYHSCQTIPGCSRKQF